MELNKKDIPVEERCEDFDKLWRKTYYEVLKYWDSADVKEITDISQLDGYIDN